MPPQRTHLVVYGHFVGQSLVRRNSALRDTRGSIVVCTSIEVEPMVMQTGAACGPAEVVRTVNPDNIALVDVQNRWGPSSVDSDGQLVVETI